jgi:hypothetical protein
VTPIEPLSGSLVIDQPRIAFSINDAESGAAGLFVSVTSSNQLVVSNVNLTLTQGAVGQYTLTIDPIGVGYSTIYLRVSDGAVTNTVEIPYAASAMGTAGRNFSHRHCRCVGVDTDRRRTHVGGRRRKPDHSHLSPQSVWSAGGGIQHDAVPRVD